MSGVLHLVVASLRPDVEAAAVARACDLGHGLAAAPGVSRVLLGRSQQALVVASFLGGRDELEPFAGSRPHMEFVLRGLPAVMATMWSAAVVTDGVTSSELSSMEAPERLWAFGLRDTPGLFEWQAQELLAGVEALPGAAWVGATVEERERYRAGGLVCLRGEQQAAFARELPRARSGWGELAATIDEASVPVEPS